MESVAATGAEQAPRAGGGAIVFILFTVLIDTIGFGIIAPIMPSLLRELTGEGLDQAARVGGYLTFLYAAVQFFAAPFLGNLSDRFGRRPVLLASLTALGIDYILMGFAPTLAWLFAGRFVAGIAGATFATANAYVSDVSSSVERAKNFGYLSAAWGLGFILGPLLGGLLGEFGARVPFFVAAALSLVNVVYGLFVLPESLPAAKRRPFDLSRANPVGALLQIRRYPAVIGFVLVMIPYQLAHDVNPTTWSYFTMLKFGWGEREVGISLAVVGVAVMVVNALFVGPAIARFGEARSVLIGFSFMVFGFLGFAFAPTGAVALAFIAPFALIGLAQPALRSMMVARVPPDAQGELQGALSSLMSLMMVISPLVMPAIFSYFSSAAAPIYFPGAAFLFAALLGLCAMALFLRARARSEGAASGAAGN